MKDNILRIKTGWSLERYSKKSGQRLWADVSKGILASRKNRPSVNVSEISRNAKDGSSVIVAGKVLGSGTIDHRVLVAADSFSSSARAKIIAAGGECIGLKEIMDANKNMKGVLLIG